MAQDWSAVPSGVLEIISKRLISWDDYVRFRSVCSSWRCAAPKTQHLPLLLVKSPHTVRSRCQRLCNFPDLDLYAPPKVPDNVNRGLCGSSRGWICFKDGTPTSIYLHNPFTGAHIRLPVLPHRTLPYKIVLSSDPAMPHNCLVMAQCHNRLMFHCWPGDDSWTLALNDYPDSQRDTLRDTIFYKGKCYVVTKFYRMFRCPVGPDNASFMEISPGVPLFSNGEPIYTGSYSESYLVVASQELWLAVVTEADGRITGCEVFRVDMDDGELRFFKLQSLGSRAVFLSPLSTSCSVDTSSASHCYRGNCVYYAGSQPMIAVFGMEDGSTSFLTDACWPSKHWLTPSLC